MSLEWLKLGVRSIIYKQLLLQDCRSQALGDCFHDIFNYTQLAYVLNINLEMWKKYLILLHVLVFAVFLIEMLNKILDCCGKGRDR